MAEQDAVTAIAYDLAVKPSFSVPEFVLRRLLKRDAAQMIERLQEEIAARPYATDAPESATGTPQ